MSHLRDSEMSVGQPGFIRAQRENKEQAVVSKLSMQVPITVTAKEEKQISQRALLLNFNQSGWKNVTNRVYLFLEGHP